MKVRSSAVVSAPGADARPHWGFWCPGCDDLHQVHDAWQVQLPDDDHLTVDPSILVTGGADNRRCHSFIRNGRWEFLSDCTHHLAGQTVDMVPLPDWVLP